MTGFISHLAPQGFLPLRAFGPLNVVFRMNRPFSLYGPGIGPDHSRMALTATDCLERLPRSAVRTVYG